MFDDHFIFVAASHNETQKKEAIKRQLGKA